MLVYCDSHGFVHHASESWELPDSWNSTIDGTIKVRWQIEVRDSHNNSISINPKVDIGNSMLEIAEWFSKYYNPLYKLAKSYGMPVIAMHNHIVSEAPYVLRSLKGQSNATNIN